MSFTSAAQLDRSTSIGSMITVDGHRWTKTARDTYSRSGIVAHGNDFGPAFRNGLVDQWTRPFNVGQVLANGHYRNVVADIDGDTVTAIVLYRSEFSMIENYPMDQCMEWEVVYPETHEIAAYSVYRNSRGLPTNEGVCKLHAFAECLPPDLLSQYDTVLDEAGVSRNTRHVSWVTMKGRAPIQVDEDSLGTLFGPGVKATLTRQQTANWTKVFSVTRNGLGCVCDTWTKADLEHEVPPNTSSWKFTISHEEPTQ